MCNTSNYELSWFIRPKSHCFPEIITGNTINFQIYYKPYIQYCKGFFVNFVVMYENTQIFLYIFTCYIFKYCYLVFSISCSSLKISIPRFSALISLLPASSPATTKFVFLDTDPVTFPPNFSISV